MNKQGFTFSIANKSGLSVANSQKALDAITEAIKNALNKGENVQLIGFGTFSVEERAERIGRNPQTGAEMKIAAKKVVKFKASKNLI